MIQPVNPGPVVKFAAKNPRIRSAVVVPDEYPSPVFLLQSISYDLGCGDERLTTKVDHMSGNMNHSKEH